MNNWAERSRGENDWQTIVWERPELNDPDLPIPGRRNLYDSERAISYFLAVLDTPEYESPLCQVPMIMLTAAIRMTNFFKERGVPIYFSGSFAALNLCNTDVPIHSLRIVHKKRHTDKITSIIKTTHRFFALYVFLEEDITPHPLSDVMNLFFVENSSRKNRGDFVLFTLHPDGEDGQGAELIRVADENIVVRDGVPYEKPRYLLLRRMMEWAVEAYRHDQQRRPWLMAEIQGCMSWLIRHNENLGISPSQLHPSAAVGIDVWNDHDIPARAVWAKLFLPEPEQPPTKKSSKQRARSRSRPRRPDPDARQPSRRPETGPRPGVEYVQPRGQSEPTGGSRRPAEEEMLPPTRRARTQTYDDVLAARMGGMNIR